MTITNREIRDYYGHNGWECRVSITNDGDVQRYGSPDHVDRGPDCWAFMGYRSDVVREIEREREEATR